MTQIIIEAIVKYAPMLAIELVQLLSKPGVTEADWEALKSKYRGRTYEQYLAEAGPGKK
jgi:hypothetical protein